MDQEDKENAELAGIQPDEKYLPKVARLLARSAVHPISENLANELTKKTVRKLSLSRKRKWSAFVEKVSIIRSILFLTSIYE